MTLNADDQDPKVPTLDIANSSRACRDGPIVEDGYSSEGVVRHSKVEVTDVESGTRLAGGGACTLHTYVSP